MRIEDLQSQVETRWAALDAPSWPPPRPPVDAPAEEEYSRVTDPARYRIVHERARLWTAVLTGLPGITAESMPSAPLDADGHLGRFDRGVRLTNEREDTLPLLLLERDALLEARDDTLAGLHVAVTEPEAVVGSQPDCGCDACDSGSADLLKAIDDLIRQVVDGPFVLLKGDGWSTQWHPEGGSSGSRGRPIDHDRAMDWCRRIATGERVRLPRGTRTFVGRSWLA